MKPTKKLYNYTIIGDHAIGFCPERYEERKLEAEKFNSNLPELAGFVSTSLIEEISKDEYGSPESITTLNTIYILYTGKHPLQEKVY